MRKEQLEKNIVSLHIWNSAEWLGKEKEVLLEIAPVYRKKYELAKEKEVKAHALGSGYLLYKYLGIQRDEQLIYNEYGKPLVKDSNIHFNLSHSGECVVMAVSQEPVGVDIEQADQIPEAALKRVLHSSEIKKLDTLPAGSRERMMEAAKRWTKVEAILKAAGTGFYTDPKLHPEYKNGWYCESREYGENYMISCASKIPFIWK